MPNHGRSLITARPHSRPCHPQHTSSREEGSALVIAIITIFVIVMISGALVASTQRARDANRVRSDRVTGLGPTDAALSTYRFGLQAKVIKATPGTPTLSWIPDSTVLREILSGTATVGGTVIPNDQLGGPYSTVDPTVQALPVQYRNTVQEARTTSGDVFDFWQIYRVQQPDAATGKDLKVWFRAWTGVGSNRDSVSNARLVVGTFRQGRFSDFQMLSNGPIRFEAGTQILGPVHSNGDADGVHTRPAGVPATATIYSDPTADISCPQAGGASVTTGVGTVYLPRCNVAGDRMATGRFVSFQGLERTFAEMRQRCNADVLCCTPANCRIDPSNTYTARLNGRSVTIGDPAFGGQTIVNLDNANGSPRYEAIIFDQNVNVSGQSTKRLSIAASGSAGVVASINVIGDLGTPTDATTHLGRTGESLGIFAQGDIVVDPSRCPREIHGVMISGSGTMTIGRKLTTATPPAAGFKCAELWLSGAVATNTAPTLSYKWPSYLDAAGNPRSIGYVKRNYVWDKGLRKSPPPFTPVTDAWEVATWADADLSCTKPQGERPSSCE